MQASDCTPPPRNPIRPWVAARAFVRTFRDDDSTEAGARFVSALDGNNRERNFQRFRRDPMGARILEERRSLVETLSDRDALRALPDGTLGRAYLDFVDTEQISSEGLVEIVRTTSTRSDLDPDRRFVEERFTCLHDLWHVATGYSRDVVGELALMSFTLVQNRIPGFVVFLAFAYAFGESRAPGTRKLIREGWRRGRRAVWLPAQDWEALLELPLEEVHERLGIGPPPVYTRYLKIGREIVAEA